MFTAIFHICMEFSINSCASLISDNWYSLLRHGLIFTLSISGQIFFFICSATVFFCLSLQHNQFTIYYICYNMHEIFFAFKIMHHINTCFIYWYNSSEIPCACHMAHLLNLLILSIRPSINGLIVVLRGNLARRGESRRLEIGGYRQ